MSKESGELRRNLLSGLAGISALAACGPSSSIGRAEGGIRRNNSPRGMTVNGRNILLDGMPYYGMGVNFYSARLFPTSEIRTLHEAGVPFIRFNAGFLSPGREDTPGWKSYLSDQSSQHDEFWAPIDRIVDAASSLNVGLMPCLFWDWRVCCDIMAHTKQGRRDSLSQIGFASSAVRGFLRKVVTEFVLRYRTSSSIWGWELFNEPFTPLTQQPIASLNPENKFSRPRLGGAERYSVEQQPSAVGSTDVVSYSDIRSVIAELSALIKQLDPQDRVISSGAALPLVQSYGIATATSVARDRSSEWLHIPVSERAQDTVAAPIYENPRPVNVVSSHIYTIASEEYFPDLAEHAPVSAAQMLKIVKRVADADGRPLYLGEFGVGGAATQSTAASLSALINAIVEEKVQLSAPWVYKLYYDKTLGEPAQRGFSSGANLEPGGEYSWMLRDMRRINDRLRSASGAAQ